MTNVTHLFTHLESVGGVQSCLRRHLEEEPRSGFPTNALIVFKEGSSPSQPNLRLSGWSTIHGARKAFRLQRPSLHPFLVYHNAWGVNLFADLDGASRRIAVLHSHWGEFEKDLERSRGLFDGFLAVSPQLLQVGRKLFPSLQDRSQLLPLAVDSSWRSGQAPLAGRAVRIGYAGRIRSEQKRLERLPPILKGLSDSGLSFVMEFMGEGHLEPTLRRNLQSFQTRFHGTKTGGAYWEILQSWDFIIYTSDYEGLPITLLEALSAGVIPLYPKINSGGDEYVAKAHPLALYENGKPEGVVGFLSSLAKQPEEQIQGLRKRCIEIARPHEAGNYHRVFQQFVADIAARPRVSAGQFANRPSGCADFVPFGVLTRWHRDAFFRTAPILR